MSQATTVRLLVAAHLFAGHVCDAVATSGYADLLAWRRPLEDVASISSIATAGGGTFYVTGSTFGSLDGQEYHQGGDAYLRQYDSVGNIGWTRLLGSGSFDTSRAVYADGLGNVYIAGYTEGSLDGMPNRGNSDAFVSKYSSFGALIWTTQLGNTSYQQGYGVSADGLGNVYVAGYTEGRLGPRDYGGGDAFVSKFNSTGALQWTHQFGTSSYEECTDVSVGSAAIFVTGHTEGSLEGTNAGGRDAFVRRVRSDGSIEWTDQSETLDASQALSVDSGYLYIAGNDNDGAFVRKYSYGGNVQWTHQVEGRSYDVSADGLGNVFFPHDDDAGFVGKYNPARNVLWTQEFGTGIVRVAADGNGIAFVSGSDAQGEFIAAVWDSPAGDYNRNAVVDAADYVAWRDQRFDAVTPCSGADGNCDSIVNDDDYERWRRHFGESFFGSFLPASGAVNQVIAPVPEPTSAAVLASGLVSFIAFSILSRARDRLRSASPNHRTDRLPAMTSGTSSF